MTYFEVGQILTGRGQCHWEAVESALMSAIPAENQWDFCRLTEGLRVEVLTVEAEVSKFARMVLRIKITSTDNEWGK